MNLCVLLVCMSLSSAPEPPPDRWLAEDKWRHLFTSFVVTTLAAGGARAAGLDVEESAWAGASVGAAAGVWKEWRDHRRVPGSASVRDLVWDAAGVGAGVGVVLQGR